MRRRTWLILALLLPGCDDLTGPGPLDYLGTYALIRVDASALPATLIVGESGTRVDALSGWLHLERQVAGQPADFTMSLTLRTSDPDGVRVDSIGYPGKYTREPGNRFILRFDGNRALCPDSGCGLGGGNGSYADSEFRFEGNPAEFRFRKR